jgi:LPXTG-motif cell wall-anchored protein
MGHERFVKRLFIIVSICFTIFALQLLPSTSLAGEYGSFALTPGTEQPTRTPTPLPPTETPVVSPTTAATVTTPVATTTPEPTRRRSGGDRDTPTPEPTATELATETPTDVPPPLETATPLPTMPAAETPTATPAPPPARLPRTASDDSGMLVVLFLGAALLIGTGWLLYRRRSDT